MFGSIIFLVVITYTSAQYGNQPPAQDNYPPQSPPQAPQNPIVIPVPVGPYPYSSSSDERNCGRCKYLKTSCEGVPHRTLCREATIKNFIGRHGCKEAIITCGHSKRPITLETIDGEKLSEGIDVQKHVKCGRREKWCARDIDDNNVNFRTVRCVIEGQGPYPNHTEPAPTPQPIAE
ncbi:hypothetical protein RB195_025924 [Necator americanus]|uniref:Uncharacterized protein n=1 Tax=Necator americanus TaxID=51031 RepID=A0ABR1EWL8_NECAM